MKNLCSNVIIFGYDTEHMFENYPMRIFVTFRHLYFQKYGIYLDFFPLGTLLFHFKDKQH